MIQFSGRGNSYSVIGILPETFAGCVGVQTRDILFSLDFPAIEAPLLMTKFQSAAPAVSAVSPDAGAGRAQLPALELLRTMAISREGDRRESILVHQGQGWLQVPAAGHEALAALVACLNADDYIFPYYRERCIALARGVSTYEIALGFFAKAASHSAGRQMSSHYCDFGRKIVASATLTALQCLPAAGTAWACQRASQDAGQNAVSVCFIGEASVRQGEFYEALCFALEKHLPLIFVIEDNGYGISTPTRGTTPWDLGALERVATNPRQWPRCARSF